MIILINTKIMFLGRKHNEKLEILSSPGALFSGSLDKKYSIVPGVMIIIEDGGLEARFTMVLETFRKCGPG